MKPIRSLSLLLTAFILIAVPARAVQSRTGGISGLLRYRDGTPGTGVRVIAIAAEEGSKAAQIIAGATLTDNSGRFLIETLPPGRYWILAGPLETGTYYPGVVSAGEAKAVTVAAGSTTDRVDFPAVRFLTIKGSVVIEDGGLIPQLRLSFAPIDGAAKASPVSIPSSGAFEIKLFEGGYHVSLDQLPKGYSLKTAAGGSKDILAHELNVGPATPPLAFTLAVSLPKPWSKVTGRLTGLENFSAALNALGATSGYRGGGSGGSSSAFGAARAPRIQLTRTKAETGTDTLPAPPPAPIQADGSFEFPMVPAGVYRVAVVPDVIVSTSPQIVVSSDDIAGLQLTIPAIREITGHVAVERNGPLPVLDLQIQFEENEVTASLFDNPRGTKGRTTVQPKIQPDGTFKLSLPEVPLRLTAPESALPHGYSVQSFSYGEADLLRDRLVIAAERSELRLNIAAAPNSWVKISGTVSGIGNALVQSAGAVMGTTGAGIRILARDPRAPRDAAGSQQPSVVLKEAALARFRGIPYQTVTPGPDGSFEFGGVFPGNYVADLEPRPIGASGPVEITVRDADIRGIHLAVPGARDVPVRLVVEGGGPAPLPRFTLTTGSSSSTVELNVRQRDNGGFSVVLPDVESGLAFVASALPAGYTVKSLSYGSTDLLRSPLKLSPSDSDELRVTLATAPNSWFKVSGDVVGLANVPSSPSAPTRNWRATISGAPLTQLGGTVKLFAPVRPDGSFEFPGLWPGDYDVGLAPSPQGMLGARVTVKDRDLSGARLVVAGSRIVTVRTLIEGNAPMPAVQLTITPKPGAGVAVLSSLRVSAESFAIPLGEQRITAVVPQGYILKAMTYGAADLLQGPGQFSATDTEELRITLAFDSIRAFRVAGRVVGVENLRPEMRPGPDGVPPQQPPVITLFDRARGTVLLTTPVKPDGSFEFPRVAPGGYNLTTTSAVAPASQVTVSDKDLTGLEIRIPPAAQR